MRFPWYWQVFVWLQKQLLNFDDDHEEDFVTLGQLLLSVDKHVITQAASEAALTTEFWSQAATIQRNSQVRA